MNAIRAIWTWLKKSWKKILVFSVVLFLGIIVGVLLQRSDSTKIYLQSVLQNVIVEPYVWFSELFDDDENNDGKGLVSLKTRKLDLSRNQQEHDTEKDSRFRYVQHQLVPQQTALVLIDVWDTTDEPNDGFADRHDAYVRDRIVPLINFARSKGIKVIHSPHSYKISERIKVLDEDIVFDNIHLPEQIQSLYFYRMLKKLNIKTVLYAGNSTHKCLFLRPDGIYGMRKLIDDMILVRDATIAFEYANTVEGEWTKNVFIHFIEDSFGSTTTLPDLIEAFSVRDAPK
jgi:hypothetical protein